MGEGLENDKVRVISGREKRSVREREDVCVYKTVSERVPQRWGR